MRIPGHIARERRERWGSLVPPHVARARWGIMLADELDIDERLDELGPSNPVDVRRADM